MPAPSRLVPWLGWVIATVGPTSVAAQGARLRLDVRHQSVSFRGIDFDSIPVGAAVNLPGQGPTTADGIAADCGAGTGYCYFFRPGQRRTGHPVTTTADLTLWGLGARGLTVQASVEWPPTWQPGRWPGPPRRLT